MWGMERPMFWHADEDRTVFTAEVRKNLSL